MRQGEGVNQKLYAQPTDTAHGVVVTRGKGGGLAGWRTWGQKESLPYFLLNDYAVLLSLHYTNIQECKFSSIMSKIHLFYYMPCAERQHLKP